MLAFISRRGFYKPKIQFRKNRKSSFNHAEAETPTVVEPYHRPRYLTFRPILDKEEIEAVNLGGKDPDLYYKKVKAIVPKSDH